MTDTAELIERLPLMAASLRNNPWSFKGEAERIEQAATALETLQSENERLRDILARYMACDGANGRYHAFEVYDVREEARAALGAKP